MAHRKNSFDLLRLYASLLVLVGHSFALLRSPAPAILGKELHGIGVEIFFAISGYLITASIISDANPVRFFAKRALRLLPGLWVCVLATAAAGVLVSRLPPWEYLNSPETIRYVYENFSLRINYALPGVFETNPYHTAVNGSLWSLPVEVLCYILLFLCMLAGRNGIIIGFAALVFSAEFFPDLSVYSISLSSVNLVAGFFIVGALIRAYNIPLRKDVAAAIALVAILSAGSHFFELLYVPALTYCVLTIGTGDCWLGQKVTDIGDMSYGIYLYAFPIQQALIFYGVRDANILSILVVLTVVPLAWLSWKFIESPSLRYKPRAPLLSV